MALPKRPRQHQTEQRSFDILRYKLGDIGIFRSQTENDYGIDFELELVKDEHATGRSIKVQVKAGEKLTPRADGVLTISGIKQSTLEYWCTISMSQNVLAFAVDLDSEVIYVTGDLFWQSTKLIDGGEATKTIKFVPPGDSDVAVAVAFTYLHFLQPTAGQVVAAHKSALAEVESFLGLLSDAYQYDAGTELDPKRTRIFLDITKTLLWYRGDALWKVKNDKARWHDYDYWVAKSEADGWDGLSCYAAQSMLSKLVPALIKRLVELRRTIMAGKYYWAHHDPRYLALVYEAALPKDISCDELIKFCDTFAEQGQVPVGFGDYFAYQAKKDVLPKKRKGKKASTEDKE